MARLPIPANVLYIGLALLLAVITSAVFNNAVNKKAEPGEVKAIETVPVVVANHELLPGSRITAADIREIDWPKAHMLPEEDIFTRTPDALNKVVKTSIFPNEPLYRYKLVGESSRGGLPVVIPPGKRAVTVAVSEVVGVAGFINPGDWVDVLTTIDDQVSTDDGKTSEPIQMTRTVLQNVQVLAIAQEMTPNRAQAANAIEPTATDEKKDGAEVITPTAEGDAPKVVQSVTLALSPAEAEKLILADEIGTLRLTLRPEVDAGKAVVSGMTREQLIGRRHAASRAGFSTAPVRPYTSNTPRRRSGSVVELYNGDQLQDMAF